MRPVTKNCVHKGGNWPIGKTLMVRVPPTVGGTMEKDWAEKVTLVCGVRRGEKGDGAFMVDGCH